MDRLLCCPNCKTPLKIGVATLGRWSKGIKKDGGLFSKTTYSSGLPVGQSEFLFCTKCSFEYSFSGSEEHQIPAFDEWFASLDNNIW